MRITEFKKQLTAKALNESAAKMFGQKLNLDSFTMEQLEDARNKLRTKIHQIENGQGFNAVYENENYSKNKLFLDVLNHTIEERSQVVEFSDMERMVLEKVDQGLIEFADLPEELQEKAHKSKMCKACDMPAKECKCDHEEKVDESVLREGEEEKAELIMASRDMVDRITGWMEDTANMQAESMLELVDSIRDELGSDVSMEFEGLVKPALASIYAALEGARQQLTQSVAVITGEGGDSMMGAEQPIAPEIAPEEAPEEELDDEEAGASAAAAGGPEAAGRAVRENAEFSRKLASLLAPKKK
jgi:hypothetical protein